MAFPHQWYDILFHHLPSYTTPALSDSYGTLCESVAQHKLVFPEHHGKPGDQDPESTPASSESHSDKLDHFPCDMTLILESIGTADGNESHYDIRSFGKGFDCNRYLEPEKALVGPH
jgi:hypothetical protein